jgi:UDP-GlcNAc:undecaprenyl-phosphate GlcNAc-1-phosphate transferase
MEPAQFELSFIVPFLFAAIVSYAATPLVITLSWRWGLIDDPKKNKHPKVIHSKPTPRGGGLAIFMALILGIDVFLPLDKHILGILAGALILVVVGLLDDKFDINPYVRLILQFIAASMPIIAGIGIAFVSNPFGGGVIDLSHPRIYFGVLGATHSIWLLSDVLALIWIVTLMNFLNWGAKGVDGQLSGVVGVAAIIIALASLQFSADIAEWPVIALAAIVAGAYLGFLPWHIYPQKIMPSFSGSNLGGYMLGVLSILTTTKVGILAVVLGVPLIDSVYTVARRLLAGKSPVWGDRGHLHHRLLDSGWSKRKIAFFYWGVTSVLGVLALNLNATTKLYTMIAIFLLVGALLFWFGKVTKKK